MEICYNESCQIVPAALLLSFFRLAALRLRHYNNLNRINGVAFIRGPYLQFLSKGGNLPFDRISGHGYSVSESGGLSGSVR
jgi:hypothetical protein